MIVYLFVGLVGVIIGGVTAIYLRSAEVTRLKEELSARNTSLAIFEKKIEELKSEASEQKFQHQQSSVEIQNLNKELFSYKMLYETTLVQDKELKLQLSETRDDLKAYQNQNNTLSRELAAHNEKLQAMEEKLETQKSEVEEIRTRFRMEFQNIANQILEDKSQKFTEMNKSNMENILKPLGENIESFKKKVEETYDKESKQRFSLDERIRELVQASSKISEDASNLANALKGQVKKQGNWGEMILERILESSGLVKGREYVTQEFIKDDTGNFLKSEDGSKLQPDVIIFYPDNRKVIIDSKVSLLAYERYCSCNEKIEQEGALAEHIKSIKLHIDGLSAKNYENLSGSLDFVMMFIPIEPAYLTAIQFDNNLWEYAYAKRVLLISPTNLIAALKLMVDLWKREYQNRNAIEIAKTGEQLYDKMVNFVDSLQDIGIHLDRSQNSYQNALKQLKDGKGNLIGQAQKLKNLGLKPKKSLPGELLSGLIDEDTETPED